MACELVAVTFIAHDPVGLARFWGAVLGRESILERDGPALLPDGDARFRIRFRPTTEPKTGQNTIHFDLTSTTPEQQQETVTRALELGARRIDIGQGPDADHVVLADPEGNEFCVIEAGNEFLAGSGFIGAVNCDGTQAVGYFWSAALGWPLVWDQDEETAVQSPHGGPKVTWSGPPLLPRSGRNRLHLDVAPPPGGDQRAEVERLLALGATLTDVGRGVGDVVVLADPDGNEFCLDPPTT